MWSIFRMMLLKFTNICFPTEVIVVNIWNCSISFVTWNMFVMGVEPFRWNSVSLCYFGLCTAINLCFDLNFSISISINIRLNVGSIGWFIRCCLLLFSCHDFVLSGNNSNFYCIWISLHLNCFLHIIMSFLLTPKAGHLVFRHRTIFSSLAWHVLNKTNHGFITLGIKFNVITGLKRNKLFSTVFSWILWDLWFNWIFEIC